MESKNLKIYQNRLFVSDLIMDVITDKKSVLEALSLFPDTLDDISLKCAFDAIMHREADEDLRKKIKDYSEVQDEYLYNISQILKKGECLPKNIITQYLKYHKDNIVPDSQGGIKSVLKKIKRMINF